MVLVVGTIVIQSASSNNTTASATSPKLARMAVDQVSRRRLAVVVEKEL